MITVDRRPPVWVIGVLAVGLTVAGFGLTGLNHHADRNTERLDQSQRGDEARDAQVKRLADDAERAREVAAKALSAAERQQRLVQALQDQVRTLCGGRPGCSPVTVPANEPAPSRGPGSTSPAGHASPAASPTPGSGRSPGGSRPTSSPSPSPTASPSGLCVPVIRPCPTGLVRPTDTTLRG